MKNHQTTDAPERPRSQLLNAAIATAQAMIERIDEEILPSLERQLDEAAGATDFDAEKLAELQSRKAAVLGEKELLSRRIELLSQQKAQALKEEGEQRLPHIVAELEAQSEETETLRGAWETALQSVVEAAHAFLPLAKQRQALLDEAEYLRLAYSTPTLPAIAPLSLPAATELKAVTDVLVSLHNPFADPWSQKKLELREQQRLSAPPVPPEPRFTPGLVGVIEHPPAPANKSFDTSRYQPGLVAVQGMTRRPESMAEKKLAES